MTSQRPPSAQTIVEALACGRSGCLCIATAKRGHGNTHCPAHDDRVPSLSVSDEEGRPLIYCHAGCDQDLVIEALRERGLWPRTAGLSRKDRSPVARYEIRDECGELAAVHCRQDGPEGKRMWWERADGSTGLGGQAVDTLPLYGSEGLRDLPDGAPVVITEGEAARDALHALGIFSGATVCGAAVTPTDDVLRALLRFTVILWPDNDDSGRTHMSNLAGRLVALGVTPKIITWSNAPEKGDAADLVAAGGTAETVRALMDAAQPWELPKAEDGAALLDDLASFVRRYVVLSSAQADAVALWTAHAHAIDAAEATPYLSVTSAEKRSGKTRLLETLELVVARPWLTGRVSAAVLMRKVADVKPTLLLDESDAAFGGDKEYAEMLRGVLNAGHRRGGVASVCVRTGGDWTAQDFPVFGPKAMASIGKLPDTVMDRAITITLKRRAPPEQVSRFRRREAVALAAPVRERLESWAGAHVDTLRDARPEIPDALDDRAADGWEPLLAIADLAGADWPERARHAALALSVGDGREDDSQGVRLLADIRTIFEERSTERLASAELVQALVAIEEAPWGDLRGKTLDARKLARRLKPFGVEPKQTRFEDKTLKGYTREDFEDAWQRYIPRRRETSETSETDLPPRFNLTGADVSDVSDVSVDMGCEHRPPGEADALWTMQASTWGDDPKACACCGSPAHSALAEDADGLCPNCRLGRPAPERGGHLSRMALDLGGRLIEEESGICQAVAAEKPR